MTSETTRPSDDTAGGGDREAAACAEFPEDPLLRDLMRLRRKRAAQRPALEAFKRERIEALRRIVERCEEGKRAG